MSTDQSPYVNPTNMNRQPAVVPDANSAVRGSPVRPFTLFALTYLLSWVRSRSAKPLSFSYDSPSQLC